MKRTVLVTGGLGFIGINLVEELIKQSVELNIERIIIYDKVSYASNYEILNIITDESKVGVSINLITNDLADFDLIIKSLNSYNIDWVFHLAAESHVDNSIANPRPFIDSNIIGTFNLLEYFRIKWSNEYDKHRFHHVSTDEVFGSLSFDGTDKFNKDTKYDPSSPYSASKAASDHLVRSYIRTFGFPATISNCSNNFGPYQHEEKLIPHVVKCLVNGEKFPLYGNGLNVRDWIYVKDHNRSLIKIMIFGTVGQTYLLGGKTPLSNEKIIKEIITRYNFITKSTVTFDDFIEYVPDRKGHDSRYEIEPTDDLNIQDNLIDFGEALHLTIKHFIDKFNGNK